MFTEEWPLWAFTLLTQLAIGTFLMLILVRNILASQNNVLAVKVIIPGITIGAPVMALALLLSVSHLGSPFGAYRAIMNIGSSWLSREILMTGSFFGLLLVNIYTHWKGKPLIGMEWLAAIAGLISVFCMASLYNASILPAWNSVNTYIVFYGTTFVLGSIGAVCSIIFSNKDSSLSPEVAEILKKIAWIAILAILIPLLYLPIYISHLSTGDSAALTSAQFFGGSFAMVLLLRWGLSLAGLGILVYTLYQNIKADQSMPMSIAYTSALLVFVGECIGRYIFYATAVSIGIG